MFYKRNKQRSKEQNIDSAEIGLDFAIEEYCLANVRFYRKCKNPRARIKIFVVMQNVFKQIRLKTKNKKYIKIDE